MCDVHDCILVRKRGSLNTQNELNTFLPLTKKVISSLAEEGILSLKLLVQDYKLHIHKLAENTARL